MPSATATPSPECNCLALRQAARHVTQFYDQCLAPSGLRTTQLSIHLGHTGIAADLRTWVNQGLMTLFFLVVGLEAKRQLDLGELRERRRLAIPVFAAMGVVITSASAIIYGKAI